MNSSCNYEAGLLFYKGYLINDPYCFRKSTIGKIREKTK